MPSAVGMPMPQDLAQQRAVQPKRAEKCRVRRQRMFLPQQIGGEPEQRQRVGTSSRPGGAGDADLRQAEPAADQGRRQIRPRTVESASASSGVTVSPTPRIIDVIRMKTKTAASSSS